MKKMKLILIFVLIVEIIFVPNFIFAKIEIDTDNDGLSDIEEKQVYKTDATKKDSDNDGYVDGEEVYNGYSPTEGNYSKLKKLKLAVPYISEAPDGNWTGPWKNACEESSIGMVEYYYRGRQSVDKKTAKDFMWTLFEIQNKKYGSNADADSARTNYMINSQTVFSGKVITNPTINQIKKELQQKRPVISLHYGFDLKNKNIPFLSGGSSYHMMVIIGYDDDKKIFYTNDPGDTKEGSGHAYGYELFMNTLHDFDHTTKKANGTPVVIFTNPKLVRTVEGSIYYIDAEKGTKHRISDPAVFEQNGWHWQGVFGVENDYLAQYTAGNEYVVTKSEPNKTSGAVKKYTFTRYLYIGSSGEEVKQLQTKLKKLGHYTYPQITGYFGQITKTALIKFQKEKKLSPYPGWVGPQTRAELNK